MGPGVLETEAGAGGCGRRRGPGDSAHPGTGDIGAPVKLWQQATPLFMGALKGRLCMCECGDVDFNLGGLPQAPWGQRQAVCFYPWR